MRRWRQERLEVWVGDVRVATARNGVCLARLAASCLCFVWKEVHQQITKSLLLVQSHKMVLAGMTPPASVKVAPLPRPYRDFLTPSLHRRFTSAALIGLAACWLISVSMASPALFWSWFPLGPAGIRAAFLFISSLSIFVLRVAQLHFGPRSTISTFESLWNYALSKNTVLICFWYTLSAFLFAELYIFSTAKDANLAWIDPGRCVRSSSNFLHTG